MAVFKFKREWYSKNFAPVLLSKHRYLIVFGGRGCFMGGQKVQTDKGLKPIADIGVGDMVLSYNELSRNTEYKPVIDTFKYDCDEEIVIVQTDKGEISCTKDHKFLINDKWIEINEAIQLKTNDSFALIKQEYRHHKGHVYDICVEGNHNYILDGGIIAHNSGKTRHIMLKLFANTFSEKHVSIIYCRHEYETIRKTTFQDLCNFLKSVPELEQYFDYSKSLNGSMVFTNKLTGNKLSPFGLDDPEKTKGISEATHIWIDEIDKCTQEQWAMVDSVLRSPQAEYLQFIGSFNPVSEKSWIRSVFFSEKDAYSPNEMFGDNILIHHSTVYDNEYIDVEAYVNSLTIAYAGDKNLLDVNIKGLWGVDKIDNPWLHAFNVNKHVKDEVPFMPAFPIYVFMDINNDPLECTLWQISPGYGSQHSFIHCIDEFSGKYKATELGSQIRAKYPHSIIFLGGDSSGQNEDVGRNQTIYQIMAAGLRIDERNLLLNKKNLTHADSYILCNSMFYNYPNLFISEKNCPNLILQCQIAEVDKTATVPFKLKKDRLKYKLDCFDSMRYMFQTIFLEFAQKTYFRALNK